MSAELAGAGMVAGFAAAALRVATPLLLAATGELLAERGGVIHLGVEGGMLAGALAAAIASVAGGPWAGVLAGAAIGAMTAALFALLVLRIGTNQIITGTAMTLAGVGITGAVYRRAFGSGGAALSIPTFDPIHLPVLGDLPVVGAALTVPVTTWVALAAVPVAWWVLYRTTFGLQLRAAGESPEKARAMGVPIDGVRGVATIVAGALAGIAGATLVLAQVGTFAEKMTAGRGYIAIAVVVLGRWHPGGVLLAALLVGALQALQFAFQAMGSAVPYQVFLMLPYLLTLAALAGAVGRVRAPAALGK